MSYSPESIAVLGLIGFMMRYSPRARPSDFATAGTKSFAVSYVSRLARATRNTSAIASAAIQSAGRRASQERASAGGCDPDGATAERTFTHDAIKAMAGEHDEEERAQEVELCHGAKAVEAGHVVVEQSEDRRRIAECEDKRSEERNEQRRAVVRTSHARLCRRAVEGKRERDHADEERRFPEVPASPVDRRVAEEARGDKGDEVLRRHGELRGERERQRLAANGLGCGLDTHEQ